MTNYNIGGYCIDEFQCSDPFDIALRESDILFRRYKEVKELQKVQKLLEGKRKISIVSSNTKSDNEAIEYVLNNLERYESKIQYWMKVDDIIDFYPRLFRRIKKFFNNL